jgi:glycosyltransferase involved in cell wall biosynthesis
MKIVACTVAIPVFNQSEFIERSICSALDQNFPGLEIIVVDNASTDGTWDVVQKFCQRGVTLHRNSRNLGLFGNFNRCLELARSPYLRLLSADDALAPGCLSRELPIMERRPDVAMVSSRGQFVDEQGRSLGRFADDFPPGVYDGQRFAQDWLSYYVHYRRNPLNYPSGVLLRRALIGGDLRFNESLKTAGDVDFFLRLLKRGNLAVHDSLGCYVTRHSNQAHRAPNLDGTAMREHLALLETFAANGRLRDQFAGMCMAVAIQRWLQGFKPSARVHLDLARSVASGRLAALAGLARLVACRVAGKALGRSAPYMPKAMQAL